jgi:hypothetical protein
MLKDSNSVDEKPDSPSENDHFQQVLSPRFEIGSVP